MKVKVIFNNAAWEKSAEWHKHNGTACAEEPGLQVGNHNQQIPLWLRPAEVTAAINSRLARAADVLARAD